MVLEETIHYVRICWQGLTQRADIINEISRFVRSCKRDVNLDTDVFLDYLDYVRTYAIALA